LDQSCEAGQLDESQDVASARHTSQLGKTSGDAVSFAWSCVESISTEHPWAVQPRAPHH
jgi:hypothetical protein